MAFRDGWGQVCEFFGNSLYHMDTYGAGVIILGVFWTTTCLLLIVDKTGHPRWMLRYKTQPGKNEPVDGAKVWKAVKVVLFNQLVVGTPMAMMYATIKVKVGCTYTPEDLPGVLRILRDLAIFTIVEEIGFYYSHRLAHWGPLYKRIHKKHHEWTAPIGLVAIYCHPIEQVFCNSLPVMLGPIVARSHMLTMWIWYFLAVFTTVVHHSGYHLPWLPSPEFHDYHHLKFNCNYGLLGWLDRFHGTDALFRGSVQRRRHRLCVGLTPLSQIYKDKHQPFPEGSDLTATNGKGVANGGTIVTNESRNDNNNKLE